MKTDDIHIYILGLVPVEDNLFTLPHTSLDASFIPFFFTTAEDLFNNDTALIEEARDICGGLTDSQCLFDFAQTRDTEAAQAGQAFGEAFAEQQLMLGKTLFFNDDDDDHIFFKRFGMFFVVCGSMI